MKSPSVFSLASFSIQLVLWTGFSTIGIAESVKCMPVSNISTGKMMICWKQSTVEPVHVLIHFHGSNDTLKAAYERTELNAVLVVVNFPGLSSAYSAPFHDDPLLFQAILKRARDSFYNSASFEKEKRRDAGDWRRISLSSFSAGYGAIREILKSKANFHRIDDIVAADSIYAGLNQDSPERVVNDVNMRDFLEFAKQATNSQKSFTISHSSQPTPYASTTETSDYLLSHLKINRTKAAESVSDTLQQTSIASRGRFRVLGFEGVSGAAHMQHLHHIDRFWQPLAVALFAKPPKTDYSFAITKLQAAIEHEVERKRLPAFSISLVDRDNLVWADGFGFQDEDKTKPATAETIYRVGSISKLFTDIAVLQLVEEGKLDLDAPIQTYLPDFKPRNPYDVSITLRQMMSHRSGLVRESPVGNYFDPDEPSLAQTVDSLNQTTLVYKPETKTKYSNAAIAVVGSVLEKQLDVSHPQRVRETIFDPLRMNDSEFVVADNIRPKLATGWMRTYDGRRFEAPNFLLGTGPAGNLYASVLDLSKFLTCLFDDGKTTNGRIIKPETLELMTTPIKDEFDRPQGFGLGFHIQDLDGHKKIGHGGAVYGFSTQLEALPDRKLGVVAASSLDGTNGVAGRLADYALRLMLATQDSKSLPDYRVTDSIPPERAARLVGSYREQNGRRVAQITEHSGDVFLRRGVFRYKLGASSNDGTIIIDDEIGFGTKIVLDGDRLSVDEITFQRLPDEPPAEIPSRWKGLIGEYGWDHNTLYILEDNGQLYALIEWFFYYPLKEVSENVFEFPNYGLYHGEGIEFTRDDDGIATELVAAEVRFIRRETGTKDGETFKIKPVKPIDELRASAIAATPPMETGDFYDTDLVDLTKLDPTIKLDIRYASTNNFTGSIFYKQSRAFMQRPAAEAVVRANRRLKPKGLGLLVHDAYRPWHVTKMFWEATPSELKDFVADPAFGSRHNRGCAVDITLYDLATGKPIQMVAGYDEFSPRSFPMYPGGTSRQRWYRELLRRTMESEGFSIYEFEWWHFDYQDWQKYRIGNVTFEEILAD